MPAPKGNQYAKGCETNGRPPEWNLAEEAKLYREWADKEESWVLREFACERNYPDDSTIPEFCQRDEEFRQAHNYARRKIGARREKLLMSGKGHAAPFMRYASLYDKELKKHEIEMKNQDPATQAQAKTASDLSTIAEALKKKEG